MVDVQGKQTNSHPRVQPVRSHSQIEGIPGMDTAQMFQLIDSILFFEACLYHQVLPLALEENRLKLGMVNPEDTVALDYISRILSHMDCTLEPQPVAADTHQALLSAYLSYREKSKPATKRGQTPLVATKPPKPTAAQPVAEATAKCPSQAAEDDLHNRPTLILTHTEALKERVLSKDISGAEEHLEHLEQGELFLEQGEKNTQANKAVVQSSSALLVLDVQATHLFSPVEVLLNLSPENLLQELLGRVLTGGIGRLYFERQSQNYGRILWSRDGVLQSVLEKLPLPVFQELVNELKLLTRLPLIPIQVKTLVEIDCLYQKNRLLLRLQIMPGVYGEQATLQVLRGAALKFYQQRQVSHLSRDAVAIARQLLRKMNELQKRIQLNGTPVVAPANRLSEFNVPSEAAPTVPFHNLNHSLSSLKEVAGAASGKPLSTEQLEIPSDLNQLLERLDQESHELQQTQLNSSLSAEQLEVPPDLNQLLESLDQINESAQAAANPKMTDENTD